MRQLARLVRAIGPPLLALLIFNYYAPQDNDTTLETDAAAIGTTTGATAAHTLDVVEFTPSTNIAAMRTADAFKAGGPLTGDQAAGLAIASPQQDNVAGLDRNNSPAATAHTDQMTQTTTSLSGTLTSWEGRSTGLSGDETAIPQTAAFHLRI